MSEQNEPYMQAPVPMARDFREAWPYALGRHIKETMELVDHVDAAKSELVTLQATSKEAVATAVKYIQVVNSQTRGHIQIATTEFAQSAAAAAADYVEAVNSSASQITDKINDLIKLQNEIIAQQIQIGQDYMSLGRSNAKLISDNAELDTARLDFEEKCRTRERDIDGKFSKKIDEFNNLGYIKRLTFTMTK